MAAEICTLTPEEQRSAGMRSAAHVFVRHADRKAAFSVEPDERTDVGAVTAAAMRVAHWVPSPSQTPHPSTLPLGQHSNAGVNVPCTASYDEQQH